MTMTQSIVHITYVRRQSYAQENKSWHCNMSLAFHLMSSKKKLYGSKASQDSSASYPPITIIYLLVTVSMWQNIQWKICLGKFKCILEINSSRLDCYYSRVRLSSCFKLRLVQLDTCSLIWRYNSISEDKQWDTSKSQYIQV
jgi:hypothetical protein